ncbi:hypothetical protein AAHE18_12G217400 [Arachis hypogaea]
MNSCNYIKKRDMTKYDVLYVLIILIIGTIVYVNGKFDSFIRVVPSVDDAYNLKTCHRKCNEAYDTSSKKSRNRLYECKKLCKSLNQCIKWWRKRFHGNEDIYKKCKKTKN